MGIDPISIAIFVIIALATAYQVVQAKKAAEKATKAAEARKGLEIPVEGDAGYLPIAYGRNKIGGFRAWHATKGQFLYTAPNADKSFLTGIVNKAGYSYDYSQLYFEPSTGNYERVNGTGTVTGGIRGYMSESLTKGGQNEFLYFQQALCLGPINSVSDVIIDEGRYVNDPALGNFYSSTETSDGKKKTVVAALRIDCHYDGGEADTIHTLNFSERRDAKFTNMAWAAASFRLNRDAPQFNGVPMLQFLIEGRKVRKVIGGVLQTTRVYTNNPAWCLLDYLLEPLAGKALTEEDLDLPSFEAAAAICDTIVQEDVRVGGKFYQNTDGTVFITNRDLPLYELNTLIDTAKPHRENIETILSSMGDGRLVWSAGQYRLSLQYPETNDDIILADTIDDTRLVEAQEISIQWPTGSERLNSCTVRFHNEFEQWKEDSASWPPKSNESHLRGIGSFRYPLPAEAGYDEEEDGGQYLNNYGVWQGDGETITLTYIFKTNPGENATYTIKAACDDELDLTIKDVYNGNATIHHFDWDDGGSRGLHTSTVNLGHATEYRVYEVTLISTDGSGGARTAVAATIGTGSKLIWTTRSVTYSEFIEVNYSDEVYQDMMEEDGQVPLEQEIFSDTITDPYHALAKAEELVRTSRTAIGFKLRYWLESKFPEPGDFLKIESETLKIGHESDLYIRVNSVKIDENGVVEVVGTRFDYTQLAWNVQDDVYINAPNLYDSRPPAPDYIAYAANTDGTPSSGVLTCSNVSGWQGFSEYVWYVHFPGVDPVEDDGDIIFHEIGRTRDPRFVLPAYRQASAFFGVRVFTRSGQSSFLRTTDLLLAIDLDMSWLSRLPWHITACFLPHDDGTGAEPIDWAYDGGECGYNYIKASPDLDWETFVDDADFNTTNFSGGVHCYQITKPIAGPYVLKFRVRGELDHVQVGLSPSILTKRIMPGNTGKLQNDVFNYNGGSCLTGFYTHPMLANPYILHDADRPDYEGIAREGQLLWSGFEATEWETDYYQEPSGADTLVEIVSDGYALNIYVNNILARTAYNLEKYDVPERYPTFFLMSPSAEVYDIQWYRGAQSLPQNLGYNEVWGSGRFNSGVNEFETTAPLCILNNCYSITGGEIVGAANFEFTAGIYANVYWTGGTHGGGNVPLYFLIPGSGSFDGVEIMLYQDGTIETVVLGDNDADMVSWDSGDVFQIVCKRKKVQLYVNGDRLRNRKISRNFNISTVVEMPSYSKMSNIQIGRLHEDEDLPSATGASATVVTPSISDTTPATAGAGTGYVEVARSSVVVAATAGGTVNPPSFAVYTALQYHRTAGAINYAPTMKIQYVINNGATPASGDWIDYATTATGTASASATIRSASHSKPSAAYSGVQPIQTVWARLVVKNSVAGVYTAAIDAASVSVQGFVTNAV